MRTHVGGVPELPVDFGELSRAADQLRVCAGALPAAGAEVVSAWDGLEAVYTAPETEELRTKMKPLTLVSAAVCEALVRAADLMDQLAEDMMWLAMRRRGLVDDAEGFLGPSRGIEDRERAMEREAQIDRFVSDVEERLERACSDLGAITPPPSWGVAIPDAAPPPPGPRWTWSARTQAMAGDAVLAPLVALVRADPSRVARLLSAHPEWEERLRTHPPSPEIVRAWWETLPPGAVAALIDGAPALIGSLGGVPPLDRVAANRVSARARLRGVEDELSGWECVLEEGATADLQADRRAAVARLRVERDYLRGVANGDVQLYLYEPADDRIVEMFGTPGPGTTRILTYVPGTFTRVDSFYRAEVQGVAQWMTDQDSGMVAFVWKGTDFPGDDQYPGQAGFAIGLLEANDPDRAAPAGEALARFQEEVSSDPSLTHGLHLAAGHSWGLVPIAASEMRGARYDQVHSLSGAWVSDGWTPNASTSYAHWSYTDALSIAQDALLVTAGRAPDTLPAFESHLYERSTDVDVPLGGDLAPFVDPDGPSLRVSLPVGEPQSDRRGPRGQHRSPE
jgi:hypothetical protein